MAKTKAYNLENSQVLPRWRYLLPWIFATVTRRARYLPPNLDWSSPLITSHIFRAWQWLVFVPYGANGVGDTIRKESAVSAELIDGIVYVRREFYTIEALVTHIEGALRSAVAKAFEPKPEYGFIPQPVFLTLMVLGIKFSLQGDMYGAIAPLIGGAIAHDAGNKNIGTASSISFSLTTSGSNRLLIIGGQLQDNTRSWSSITYAGNATTQIGSNIIYTANSAQGQMRYQIAPTTGANDAVFTASGSIQIRGMAVNYTGCAQSGQPDGTAQGSGSSSQNVTVTASNCWMVSQCVGFNSEFDTEGFVTLAGTLTTLRQYYDDGMAIADSNGAIGTGSQAYQWSNLNSTNGRIAASIAPVASTPVTVTPAALVLTFSLPSRSILFDKVINVNTQVGTFSVPAYTVSLPKLVGANVQVAVFSIPAYTVDAGGNITVAVGVQTCTFSIPVYSILKSWVQAVNTMTATFSTPAPTIGQGTGVAVSPNTQVVTMSIPAYTVTVVASIVISVAAQVLTFSLPTLAKVGSIWRKVARSTSATWSRISRNSN